MDLNLVININDAAELQSAIGKLTAINAALYGGDKPAFPDLTLGGTRPDSGDVLNDIPDLSSAPETTPAPTPSQEQTVNAGTGEVQLDGDGIPHDKRIHSDKPKITAKGKWQRRKNITDELYNQVTAELKVQYANTAGAGDQQIGEVPNGQATQPQTTTAPASQGVGANVPATSPSSPPAGMAPEGGVPSNVTQMPPQGQQQQAAPVQGALPTSGQELMAKLPPLMVDGTFTTETINGVLSKYPSPEGNVAAHVGMLAQPMFASVVPAIINELQAIAQMSGKSL